MFSLCLWVLWRRCVISWCNTWALTPSGEGRGSRRAILSPGEATAPTTEHLHSSHTCMHSFTNPLTHSLTHAGTHTHTHTFDRLSHSSGYRHGLNWSFIPMGSSETDKTIALHRLMDHHFTPATAPATQVGNTLTSTSSHSNTSVRLKCHPIPYILP